MIGAGSICRLYVVCCGVKFRKKIYDVFSTGTGLPRRFCLEPYRRWFLVRIRAVEMFNSPLASLICVDCTTPLTSLSVSTWDLIHMWFVFKSVGRFRMGSGGFTDVQMSMFSVSELFRKTKNCISTFVLFCLRAKSSINGVVRLVMTMNYSVRIKSAASSGHSIAEVGLCNCPLAAMTLISGGGFSLSIVYGAINGFFRKSASGIVPDTGPVPMWSSFVNTLKSIAK